MITRTSLTRRWLRSARLRKGSIMKLAVARRWNRVDLDRLAGPRYRARIVPAQGRIVEIYGPESSGKTTLALHVCRGPEEGDLRLRDAEHALDPAYAKKLASISQPPDLPARRVSRRSRSPTRCPFRRSTSGHRLVAALVPPLNSKRNGDSLPGLQAA